ncbi:MAG: hypothetical protein JWM28_3944 [Chitinophagaceae bacterium]|nr:hypothetical protein [Chitinophagaceae bacterium]
MKTIITRVILLGLLLFTISIKAIVQEVKVKAVSNEFSSGNTTAIDIEIQRDMNVEIVPWEGANVKIVYQYNPGWYKELSDAIFSDLGFNMVQSGSAEKITVGSMPLKYFRVNRPPSSSQSDYIVIDGKKYFRGPEKTESQADNFPTEIVRLSDYPVIDEKKNYKGPEKTEARADNFPREKVTFYIPRSKKLILKLYYNGSITIAENLIEADITTSFGGSTLKAKSIQKLSLKAYYPRASFDTIGEAFIDVMGGQLFIKKITKLNAQSRYASVQINSAEEVNLISSQSDVYVIEQIGTLTGSQKFGVCRINVLNKDINMEESSDIVIKNIMPGAGILKIKSTQVTLNLPVSNLKNYSLSVNGSGSTLQLTEDIRKGTVSGGSAGNEPAPVKFGGPGSVKFTSNVGDINGSHTVFDINCLSCNISFK